MISTSADTLCIVKGTNTWHAHATCVAQDDHALLILGESGMGKSSLAVGMMALGCALISDDLVVLQTDEASARIMCQAPPNAPACIEMRGFGLLPIPLKGSAQLSCCLLLGDELPARLPQEEYVTFGTIGVPLYRVAAGAALAAQAFMLLRQGGRTQRD